MKQNNMKHIILITKTEQDKAQELETWNMKYETETESEKSQELETETTRPCDLKTN